MHVRGNSISPDHLIFIRLEPTVKKTGIDENGVKDTKTKRC